MIKPQLPRRSSSTSSVVFWFLILLSFLLSFLFSSLFLFSGWASNIESFGGFHVFWGQSVRGCCMFCSCYFSVFLCRVLTLVFALEEGGGGSQLKSSVAFPLDVCSVD